MRRETLNNIKQKLQHTISLSSYDSTLLNKSTELITNLFKEMKKQTVITHTEIKSSKNTLTLYKTTITTTNPKNNKLK